MNNTITFTIFLTVAIVATIAGAALINPALGLIVLGLWSFLIAWALA